MAESVDPIWEGHYGINPPGGISVDSAWETPSRRGRRGRTAPRQQQQAPQQQQLQPPPSQPANTGYRDVSRTPLAPPTSIQGVGPPLPSTQTGYASGGPVTPDDDDDDVYPSTAPAWTAGGYASALGLADNADQGYARGGPVKRRIGYDDGGPVDDEDTDPSTYEQPVQQPASDTAVPPETDVSTDTPSDEDPREHARRVLEHTREQYGLNAQPTARYEELAERPRLGGRYEELAERPATGYQDAGIADRINEQPASEQPPTSESGLGDLVTAAAGKFWGSRAGIANSPDIRSGPELLSSAVRTLKGGLASYVRGDNALPPNDLDIHLRHAADSDPDGNPGDHAVRAVTNPDLNPDGQAAVLAGLRQRYDSMITHAQGAMAHGDVPTAIELAQRAHDQVPDGQDLHLQTDGGGTVTATVRGPGGDVSHPMTLQQFHDYLVGPATSFDHVIENGLGRNLQIASGNSGARETGSAPETAAPTPETAAPPQTGYGDERTQPLTRDDVERQQIADAKRSNPYDPGFAGLPQPPGGRPTRQNLRGGRAVRTPDGTFRTTRNGELIRPDGTIEYTPGYQSQREIIDANTGERLTMGGGAFAPRIPRAPRPGDVRGSLNRPFGFSAGDNAYKHLSASGALDIEPSDQYGRSASQQAAEGARPWTSEMPRRFELGPYPRGAPPHYSTTSPQPYYDRNGNRVVSPQEQKEQGNFTPSFGPDLRPRTVEPETAVPATPWDQRGQPSIPATDTGYTNQGQRPVEQPPAQKPYFGPDWDAIRRDPNGPEARAQQQYPMASQDRQRRDAIEKNRASNEARQFQYDQLRSLERRGELTTEQKIRLEGLRQSGRLDVTNANNTAKDTRQQNWLAQKDRHLDFLQDNAVQKLAQQRLSATDRNAITLYNSALNGGRDPPPNAKAAVQKLFGIAAQEGLETPGALPPQNAPTVQTAPTAQAPAAQTTPTQAPQSGLPPGPPAPGKIWIHNPQTGAFMQWPP